MGAAEVLLAEMRRLGIPANNVRDVDVDKHLSLYKKY